MDEVRRDEDGELCGQVDERDGRWRALTVFGGVLGEHEDGVDAVDHVLRDGLASLAERWTLHDPATGADEVVCIQEANPGGVTVAVGYYSMPGVPTRTITAAELASGEFVLRR
jgi:hypothetical protein